MENKKTVDEIEYDILNLAGQKFELEYGLSKNQYSKLIDKIFEDVEHMKKRKEDMKKIWNLCSDKKSKSKTEITMDLMRIDMNDLKSNIKHIKKINKIHSISIILLSISLIISILF